MKRSSKQLRIRLSPGVAARFEALPPLARARAVSMLLGAQSEGVDLPTLLQLRGELARLGTLLNQSLKTSWGRSTDAQAASEVVRILEGVLR